MNLAVVGVGSAGGRLVNQILVFERSSGRDLCNGNSLVINSKPTTFDTTEYVPEERRLTIGDVYWEVDKDELEDDPDVAAEVAREEKNELNRAYDLLEFHEVDGILVLAGLAGGTGGGAGAVVIDQLSEICDAPVYAVGILPEESEGRQPALNASRALQSYVENAANVIVFDNETWVGRHRSEHPARDPSADGATANDPEPAEVETESRDSATSADDETSGYASVNELLAARLVTLFATGKFTRSASPENCLDPSDVIRTLDTGGISSIGYASIDLPRSGGVSEWLRGLRERFPWLPTFDTTRFDSVTPSWLPAYEFPGGSDQPSEADDGTTDAEKINRLVRRAARGELTLPCEFSSADRALIVLSGPSKTLSRTGFENGRYWLEREADIVDVTAGDEPHDRARSLTAVVLFSNVTDVPRIKEMQAQAVDHTESPSTEGSNYGTANPT